MRYEITHWDFEDAAADGVVVPKIPMPDFERVYLSVEVTEYGDAGGGGDAPPTNIRFHMRPLLADGTALEDSLTGMQTQLMTAVGIRSISLINTTDHPFAWTVCWPAVEIYMDMTGGVNPRVSGTVHVIGVVGEA